jgi:hypothetical protein
MVPTQVSSPLHGASDTHGHLNNLDLLPIFGNSMHLR